MNSSCITLVTRCLRRSVLALSLSVIVIPTGLLFAAPDVKTSKTYVYFGTFSRVSDGGVFVSVLDSATGAISDAKVAAHAESPGFLAIDSEKQRVYAISQTGDNNRLHGCVDSFAIDNASGQLEPLSHEVTPRGPFCYLALDRTRGFLGAARYNDGNAVIFPVDANGRIQPVSSEVQHQGSGPNRERQEKAHVHSINFSPDNRFAIVADLGIDEIRSYRFDAAKGTLAPTPASRLHTAPGSGPRHFTFHPSSKFAYAVCEVDATILALAYDAVEGALKLLQVSPLLPVGTEGEQRAAEVVVHPSGNYVYVSNRGYDSLVVYLVDKSTGKLSFIQREHEGIAYPRNFAIDPSGRWLLCANRDSNSITVYSIDQNTGRISRTGHSTKVPQPVCVRFYTAK